MAGTSQKLKQTPRGLDNMSNRPYEDEGVVRTDEQAGTPGDQLKAKEREFDAAHPPVAGNDPRETRGAGDDPKQTFRQKDQIRSSEQDEPQKEVGKRYQDS